MASSCEILSLLQLRIKRTITVLPRATRFGRGLVTRPCTLLLLLQTTHQRNSTGREYLLPWLRRHSQMHINLRLNEPGPPPSSEPVPARLDTPSAMSGTLLRVR